MGNYSERTVVSISDSFVSPKGQRAYKTFLAMTKEKVNNQVAISELLRHVAEMLPKDVEERENMRDNLKEIYHGWLNDGGRDTVDENWSHFTNLYNLFDEFLKMSKNVDSKTFLLTVNQLKNAELTLN